MPAPTDLHFVFVVPCLNEELVIGRSLERLLSLPSGHFSVLVVDDGSDDRTSEIVRSFSDERVWLLRRDLPEARQGKGAALNAAFHYLLGSRLVADTSAKNVVLAVLDADGRLAPNALFEVAPYFRDPKAGAVQIGVRMYNAHDSFLARMQDFEFVTFTEVYQRARQRMGSVGLGGNGQFARLSALRELGDEPWTDCLTEDLDLGLRLLDKGYTNNFCPTTAVHQQAVTNWRRLIRQRSRWFQGHLQCWKRIPMVLRSRELSTKTVSDLLYHLLSPALVLMMSLPLAAFVFGLAALLIVSPAATGHALVAHGGLLLAAWYLLAFGLAPFYGFVYWLKDRETSAVRALLLAHAFTLYSYFWLPAGWWAVGRVLRGSRSWAKTARTVDSA